MESNEIHRITWNPMKSIESLYRIQRASNARIIDFPMEIDYFLKFTNDLT